MRKILFSMGLLLLCASQARAALIVQSTVTPAGGGLFHYEFSVTNNTIDDVVFVSIDAVPGDLNIGASLVTPVGFLGSYDSGLGLVDFLEFTDLFAIGTTRSGFSFDSAFGPGAGRFDTFTALTSNLSALDGPIDTVVVVPGVPEPTTAALLALGVFGLAGSRTARRLRH